MLYKVVIGRDTYLGTAEEVVGWMSRAQGAPSAAQGGLEAFMQGIAARATERVGGVSIDASSPVAFLESLREAGLVRVEERPEASSERVDVAEVVRTDDPITIGEGMGAEDLEDVMEDVEDAMDDVEDALDSEADPADSGPSAGSDEGP